MTTVWSEQALGSGSIIGPENPGNTGSGLLIEPEQQQQNKKESMNV